MVKKEHRSIMVGCILYLVLGSIWIFKDVMFQAMFSYKKIGERTHYSGFSDDSLFSGEGTYNSGDREDVDLVTLINDALHFSDMQLSFAATNTRNEPDALVKHGRAHCIGYSAFFKATLEELLERKDIEYVEVQHAVSEVYLAGINLHQFTSRDFFKDHDYNIVVDRLSGNAYFVDSSLHDMTGIGFVRGSIYDS